MGTSTRTEAGQAAEPQAAARRPSPAVMAPPPQYPQPEPGPGQPRACWHARPPMHFTAWSGLASSPTDSHLRRGQLDALQRPLYAANRAGYRWHNGAPAAALIVAGVLSVPAVTAPAADRAQPDPRPPHPLSSSGWTSPQLASPHHGGHRTRRPPRPGRPPWPGRAQPAR